MSVLPGGHSWRDAGLVEPDPDDVVEIVASADEPAEDEYDPEPEPDVALREASEADHVEQLLEVPDDEREDYP